MMAALTTANAAFAAVAFRMKVGSEVVELLPEKSGGVRAGSAWFLAKSGVSYGGLMIIQSLSLVLPPSTLTLLTVPMKIVASVAATFVNAILPRMVHQTAESPAEGRAFLRILVVWLVPAGITVNIALVLAFPNYSLIGIVVALWLVASACSSVAQRLAFRFLPPSASRITMVVVPVVVLAVALSAPLPGFGLIALLAAYATVDALSGLLLLIAMRDRIMTIVLGLATIALAAIWVSSVLFQYGI
ncbi:hypothetical protein GCM10009722_27410 [Williamsia deligens]